MVTIINFDQPFIIHKEVACYSPVLRAAFASNFVEGQTQTYTLDIGIYGVDDGGLQLVVQWRYRQSFKPCLTQAESEAFMRHETSYQEILVKVCQFQGSLLNAWVIADYLQLPRCQNLVVDEFDRLWFKYRISGLINLEYLYKNLPQESTLRKLTFEHCRRFLTIAYYKHTPNPEVLFPHAYLLDCVVADRADKANPPAKDPFTDREEFKRRFHVPEE